MQYIEGLKEYTDTGKSAVTFGKFDGLHRGHQKLVDKVKGYGESDGVKTVVCAFDMPGRQVIMTADDRKRYLKDGVDFLVNCPFTEELKHMGAEAFIEEVIKGVFHAKYVVIGTDFRFGYGQKGDALLLKTYEEKYDYKTIVVEKERYKDRIISSTYIKELLEQGEVELAGKLLGYPYSVSGTVRHGKRLGRTLGFPTLNVQWPKEKLLPPRGVYASKSLVDGIWYESISNVGIKPTVSTDDNILIESYLFDYDGDAYGKDVCIELYDFRRPERKFSGTEEMKTCIGQDIAYGKSYFKR